MEVVMNKTLVLRSAAAVCILAVAASAQQPSGDTPDLAHEVAQLKSRVAAQQEQIDELRRLLESQNKLLLKLLPESSLPSTPRPAAAQPLVAASHAETAPAKPPLS